MKQSRGARPFLTVFSYHVIYAFYSECTLCSCLNIKELLARNRRVIWRFKHLFRKRTLIHLAPIETHKAHLSFLCKRWTSTRIIRLDRKTSALPTQEDILLNSEVYLGPSRNSTIEMFWENSSRQISVVDVRLGSKYVLRI